MPTGKGPSSSGTAAGEVTERRPPSTAKEREVPRIVDVIRARLERWMGQQAEAMTIPRADVGQKAPIRVMSTNWAAEHDKAQRELSALRHGAYNPTPSPQGTTLQMSSEVRATTPRLPSQAKAAAPISAHKASFEALRARMEAAAESKAPIGPALETAAGRVRVRATALPQGIEKNGKEGIEPEI